MRNALKLYGSGKTCIACAVSFCGEKTLSLCLYSLAQIHAQFAGVSIISDKVPMCESFNAALDFACNIKADILFHTAADVIVAPDALRNLLDLMDVEDNYLAIGKGYDSIHGPGSSVGVWIWNMGIVGRNFRFRDVFKQDLDICQRIEEATGKTRIYTPIELILGYHHFLWTAEELFLKYRYSLPKYGNRQVRRMKNFLKVELDLDPTNKVLLAGLSGAEAAEKYGALTGSKNNKAMHEEFIKLTKSLNIEGTEYYIARPDVQKLGENTP